MDNSGKPLSELRKIIWPIEGKEHKKFLPMAFMMFCILLNYSTLRTIKDGFVVTGIGPEAISFLKTYIVLPAAILTMVIYAKLCNIMSRQKVFYTITSFFVIYIAFFAFVLYPNPTAFHPNPETIENLSSQFPNFKWFIRIIGKWDLATFYTIAELWGSVMLSLLFWQFANQTTKTEEAKRFYSFYGIIGNLGLLATSQIIGFFLDERTTILSVDLKFIPIFIITILSGILIMLLYKWINDNVLTDPDLYSEAGEKPKKNKVKLSLKESFEMIFTSKYLGLIAMLVLAYGISINLVEGVWKAKIRDLYTTTEQYTVFMAGFQFWQGLGAILFMIVGSNILRKVSWFTAAILTPLMVLVTGSAFFIFIFFDNVFAMYLTGIMSGGALAAAVQIGMAQNVLAKATKYSLFDSTKEMTYIPLDDELRTKGKAAVDVVGGRFGKSGGGIIQSTFFMLLPAFTFTEATPYFAGIFFVIVIAWLYAVKALSKEYHKQIEEASI